MNSSPSFIGLVITGLIVHFVVNTAFDMLAYRGMMIGTREEVASVLRLDKEEVFGESRKYDTTVEKVYTGGIAGMNVCIKFRQERIADIPENERYDKCAGSPINGEDFTHERDAALVAAGDLGKLLLPAKE